MNLRVQELIKEDLKQIMRDVVSSQLTEEDLMDSKSIEEDLKIDSLDRMMLMADIERIYGIDIPDEESAAIKTVGDAHKLIVKTVRV